MDLAIERKHRGLGIASFVIALSFLVLIVVLFAVAGAVKLSGAESPAIDAAVGLIMILFWVCQLVALGLGTAGLFDKSSKKAFPVLGVLISGLCVVFTAAAVGYGIYAKAHDGENGASPAVFQKAELVPTLIPLPV